VGVLGATIKGVPWPITVMAGFFCTAVAGAYLVALPIFIRAETRPVSEPNKAPQPIKPNYDAWKHVEKFTVRQAASLLENLEPSTVPQNPRVEAWINALSAAIRTGKLELIVNTEDLAGYHVPNGGRNNFTREQRAQADWSTEIPKKALMDFAKRNNIDLKYLA
jgi:hypothetical protein